MLLAKRPIGCANGVRAESLPSVIHPLNRLIEWVCLLDLRVSCPLPFRQELTTIARKDDGMAWKAAAAVEGA